MVSDLLPISFEEVPAAAVQGWLWRYPQGVEFVRPAPPAYGLTPVCVRPRKPEQMFESPSGQDSWAEYYQPSAVMMKQAIVELAGMRSLSGEKFRNSVDAFVRQFGPLAMNAWYLDEHRHVRSAEPMVEYILRGAMTVDAFPLWCYKREARVLADTLSLYRSVREGDVERLENWEVAWLDVLARIEPYLKFVGFGFDWVSHKDNLKATSPDNLIPFIPNQQLQADNLLGAIYIHVLQVVLDQQLVRSCAARGCNRMFVPTRSDQIYCTPSCASSERVRRHRENKRAAKG